MQSIRHEFTNAEAANFHGTYLSTCHLSYFQDLKVHAITTETFSVHSNYEQHMNFFWDSDCKIPYGKALRHGKFDFFSYDFESGAHTGLALTYDFSGFTPATPQVANLLDTEHFCARADWISGVATQTMRSKTTELTDLAPTDSTLENLMRTECTSVVPENCAQVTLTRQKD